MSKWETLGKLRRTIHRRSWNDEIVRLCALRGRKMRLIPDLGELTPDLPASDLYIFQESDFIFRSRLLTLD
jgi:hypothetical protein